MTCMSLVFLQSFQKTIKAYTKILFTWTAYTILLLLSWHSDHTDGLCCNNEGPHVNFLSDILPHLTIWIHNSSESSYTAFTPDCTWRHILIQHNYYTWYILGVCGELAPFPVGTIPSSQGWAFSVVWSGLMSSAFLHQIPVGLVCYARFSWFL